MAGLIIVMVIFIIICIILSIYAVKIYKENISLWQRLHKKDNDSIKAESFENRISQSEAELNRLNQLIEDRTVELKLKTDELSELNITYNEKNDEYIQKFSEVINAFNDLNSLLTTVSEERNEVEQDKLGYEKAIEVLKPQLQNIEQLLKQESERHRLAVLNNEDQENLNLWELIVSIKEQQLISILEQIKNNYPELIVDISTIEWKRVWLPKLQDLCNREQLNGTAGIYRLILKDDHEVCYVGQAVDIKERWYQHVKKMIGVDAKGYEKLYQYRPEDFYWTVQEEAAKSDLNAAEQYWIEYYACKEKGLNKKL